MCQASSIHMPLSATVASGYQLVVTYTCIRSPLELVKAVVDVWIENKTALIKIYRETAMSWLILQHPFGKVMAVNYWRQHRSARQSHGRPRRFFFFFPRIDVRDFAM
jgi:hypothetical protein